MTLLEISTKFDLPLSTLKDWRNPQSKKHKLFIYLQNAEESNVGLPYVRLLQLLNRNIAKEYQFTSSELHRCFKKKSYERLTQREKIIASRLFKDGDVGDAQEIASNLNIDQENIKSIFKSSPFFNANGFSVWMDAYGFQSPSSVKDETKVAPKAYLTKFLQQRGINV